MEHKFSHKATIMTALQRFKPFMYYVPLALALAYYIVRAVGAPYSDFAGYYFGSAALLKGDYKIAYDNYAFNLLIAQQGYKGIFVSYMPFPPFTALVFAPFLLLKPLWAKIAFNVISCLLFLFTLRRTVKFFAVPGWAVALLPVIFFMPLRNGLFFGQSYLLLLLLLLEGYMAFKKGKPVLSSFLWAVAILFKLFPGLILIFLLLRKQYKNVVYTCMAALVLVLISLGLSGFDSWKFYIANVLPRVSNGELNSTYTYLFQSFFMLLRNLFVYDELMNPGALFDSPALFLLLLALFKAFILALCIGATWKRKGDFLPFALWITGSMLVSPNGSTYSLVLLIIPFLAVVHEAADMRVKQKTTMLVLLAALLLLICNVPLQSLASWPVLFKFPRLYLLLVFWLLLLWRAPGAFDYRVAALLFITFMVPGIIALSSPRQNSGSYLLPKDAHILIYDYEVKDHKLVYYYWDDTGAHELVTGYAIDSISSEHLGLQQNQIWYKGKQLTGGGDWKKKPMLVNGSTIVYLSDKNRGVSFYTLRKLSLTRTLHEEEPAGSLNGR